MAPNPIPPIKNAYHKVDNAMNPTTTPAQVPLVQNLGPTAGGRVDPTSHGRAAFHSGEQRRDAAIEGADKGANMGATGAVGTGGFGSVHTALPAAAGGLGAGATSSQKHVIAGANERNQFAQNQQAFQAGLDGQGQTSTAVPSGMARPAGLDGRLQGPPLAGPANTSDTRTHAPTSSAQGGAPGQVDVPPGMDFPQGAGLQSRFNPTGPAGQLFNPQSAPSAAPLQPPAGQYPAPAQPLVSPAPPPPQGPQVAGQTFQGPQPPGPAPPGPPAA